jgi:predicted DNA-binding protein YlxM (UPF0122 family)
MNLTLPSKKDIEAIKAGDAEKTNAFFLQSIDSIRLCACGFYTKYWKKAFYTRSDIDELVNEAYLHLHEMDYDSIGHFVVSLRDVFFFFQFGGKTLYYRYYTAGKQLCESLDKPAKVDARTGDHEEGVARVDLLEAREQVPYTKIEKTYAILQKIVEGFLTEKEYEIFRYRLLTGYTAEEIAKELGKTKGAVLSQMCTMRKSLIIHYTEILALLSENGITQADYYIDRAITPPEYESVKEFYERRRARGRERERRLLRESGGRERKNEKQRAYRARKKQAESPQHGQKNKKGKRSDKDNGKRKERH